VLLQSGQKPTLGLLATITLEVAPYQVCAPFPALLPVFKCILEVVFVTVLSTGCYSASITSFVSKWLPFSFIFDQENRKVAGAKSGE
jgi:hypothetical protein